MKRATAQQLRSSLERLRTQAIRNRCVDRDPLQLVRASRLPADQEVVGLLAALLAYGRVDLMRAHIGQVLSHLGSHPASKLKEAVPRLPPLVYRFHRTRDLHALLRGIRTLLLRHGSLGDAFAFHWEAAPDLRAALANLVADLRTAAGPSGPGLRYLLPDPALGGACKRWHLYLRWMVRSGNDDPDLGIWSGRVPPSVLLIPLDTHVVRISQRLGWTSRRNASWRMAEEVTAVLRKADMDDPIRYDLALCHLGIDGVCSPRRRIEQCRICPLMLVCPTGRAG